MDLLCHPGRERGSARTEIILILSRAILLRKQTDFKDSTFRLYTFNLKRILSLMYSCLTCQI